MEIVGQPEAKALKVDALMDSSASIPAVNEELVHRYKECEIRRDMEVKIQCVCQENQSQHG